MNETLWGKAAEAKVLRTHRVRADTTVIPGNMAYPTDSGLLAKAVVSRRRAALPPTSQHGDLLIEAADPACRVTASRPGNGHADPVAR